jgi:hypothetical protein
MGFAATSGTVGQNGSVVTLEQSIQEGLNHSAMDSRCRGFLSGIESTSVKTKSNAKL